MLINSLVYVRASRRIEFEFWVLVLVEEGKLVKQGQNNIETRTRINSKSTQVGRRVQESNPGHIDGMLTASQLRHLYSLFLVQKYKSEKACPANSWKVGHGGARQVHE